MGRHYYEVQIECYNAKGEVYFTENYRYAKRHSAVQKLSALKRHHPSSEIILIKKSWKPQIDPKNLQQGPNPTEDGCK